MKKTLIYSVCILLASCAGREEKEVVVPVESDPVEVVDNLSEIERIEQEIVENPESPNVYLKRSLYRRSELNYDGAIEDINLALKITPDVAELNYQKAELLFQKGIYKSDVSLVDEAEIYLNHTLVLDSLNVDAHLLFAEIKLADGNIPAALKHVNDVLRDNDASARAYFVKGEIYDYMGKPEAAESSYQTAIEMDVDYYKAYVRLGLIHHSKGSDQALDYYNSALAIYPNSIEAIRNKGIYYHDFENYYEAFRCFKQMAVLDSTNEEAYFNMGNTYVGRYRDAMPEYSRDTTVQKAMDYFEKSIEINPDYIQALQNLARGYEMKQEFVKARELYNRILVIEPGYEGAIYSLEAIKGK